MTAHPQGDGPVGGRLLAEEVVIEAMSGLIPARSTESVGFRWVGESSAVLEETMLLLQPNEAMSGLVPLRGDIDFGFRWAGVSG